MHSVFNNRMPLAFQDYFQEIDHNYETRTRTNVGYYLPFPRTERGKKSLRYTGVHIWAEIPHSFRNYPVKLFKTSLKNYLITNANSIRLVLKSLPFSRNYIQCVFSLIKAYTMFRFGHFLL